MRTVTALWPDGHLDTATSWRGLEKAIRRGQRRRMGPLEFRRVMVHRAMQWSRTKVTVLQTAEGFLRALERAGLCRLEVEGDE